ncbi:MAG: response regulator [Rhodothermales bacterium]
MYAHGSVEAFELDQRVYDESVGNKANILVVDDNLINRKKLSRAVEALGHQAAVAEDGTKALSMLLEGNFDAILLDIIMPEMDGFDVLVELSKDSVLRDIPVIVISALEDETSSVVKAIELGAEDFLPKSFDPVLLKARLDASLTKKRFRDQEREYYSRINRLTEAAGKLEKGHFDPEDLELDDLVNKTDSLGKLAAVFRGMANEIYQRELKLNHTIHVLRGSLLVLAIGVIWGLTPALGRLASGLGSNPIGLVIWTNSISGVFLLAIAAYNNKLPKLNIKDIAYFIVWAIIAGVLQRTTTFIASSHIEASMLSLILTLQGFMIFAFATVMRIEKVSTKRLIGLAIGLFGVALVLWYKFDPTASAGIGWLLFACLIPFFLSLEALLVAGRQPKHVDEIAAVGLMMLFSSIILLPIGYARNDLMALSFDIGRMEIFVALMVFVSTSTYIMMLYCIKTAGAIFYSQSAYTTTIAGVVWGMLLLSEELSVLAWVAFVLILIGMYLVEPKADDKKIIIQRNFDN